MMANTSRKNSPGVPDIQTLLERHGRELFAYLWRMLGDQQDAEDCLQDTFIRAHHALHRTASDWNHRAWLFKIATNVARTNLGRRRIDLSLEGLVDPAQRDPLVEVEHRDELEHVLAAMSVLSMRQRSAIMMRKYSELDYVSVGEALECSPETARAHVYQGLKRLRERFEAPFTREGVQHG